MALKITLKPNERIIIDGAVITNGGVSAQLIIGNNVPILRQKDIMTEAKANTHCRRIYLVIQLMYVDGENLSAYHKTYWSLVKDLIKAAPSTLPFVDRISDSILNTRYYQALKLARKLIAFEEEALKHVRNTGGGL